MKLWREGDKKLSGQILGIALQRKNSAILMRKVLYIYELGKLLSIVLDRLQRLRQ